MEFIQIYHQRGGSDDLKSGGLYFLPAVKSLPGIFIVQGQPGNAAVTVYCDSSIP